MKEFAALTIVKGLMLILSPVYLMFGAPIVALIDQDKVWDYFDIIF